MTKTKSPKRTIRALRHWEALPSGTPRRYLNSHGYITLRWKVGKGSYVDLREHRLVAGRPPDHLHVHHINGIKTDNRPENLVVVTIQQHRIEHITFDLDDAAKDYRSGMSYPQLSAKYGVHQVTLMRGLKKHRSLMSRGIGESRRVAVDAAKVVGLHDSGWRASWIAEEVGCTAAVVRRCLRENGASKGTSGRPQPGERERVIGVSTEMGYR